MHDLSLGRQVPLLPVRPVAGGHVHVGVVRRVVAVAADVETEVRHGAVDTGGGAGGVLGGGGRGRIRLDNTIDYFKVISFLLFLIFK